MRWQQQWINNIFFLKCESYVYFESANEAKTKKSNEEVEDKEGERNNEKKNAIVAIEPINCVKKL